MHTSYLLYYLNHSYRSTWQKELDEHSPAHYIPYRFKIEEPFSMKLGAVVMEALDSLGYTNNRFKSALVQNLHYLCNLFQGKAKWFYGSTCRFDFLKFNAACANFEGRFNINSTQNWVQNFSRLQDYSNDAKSIVFNNSSLALNRIGWKPSLNRMKVQKGFQPPDPLQIKLWTIQILHVPPETKHSSSSYPNLSNLESREVC